MTDNAITCGKCKKKYAVQKYHAGFSDVGFLYCDRDSTVMTFNMYDDEYWKFLGSDFPAPWTKEKDKQEALVQVLEKHFKPCPCGGKFSFKNTLRCPACNSKLSGNSVETIYFYVIDDRHIDGAKTPIWKET